MDKLAFQFRAATLDCDFVLAEKLASEYVQAVRIQWESLPKGNRDSGALVTQAQELLSWAREVTIVQRALAAEQLTAVETASRYSPIQVAPSRPHALEVRA